jgi:hypothetical protein
MGQSKLRANCRENRKLKAHKELRKQQKFKNPAKSGPNNSSDEQTLPFWQRERSAGSEAGA